MNAQDQWLAAADKYEAYSRKTSLRPDSKKRDKPSKEDEKRFRRLPETIKRLFKKGLLREGPTKFSQAEVDEIIREEAPRAKNTGTKTPEGPAWFKDIWRLLVLHKYSYRCWICGRDGNAVLAKIGYAPRFELDHVIAKARKHGPHYSLKNILPACRECNTARGQMETELFVKSLETIARSVAERRPGSGHGVVVLLLRADGPDLFVSTSPRCGRPEVYAFIPPDVHELWPTELFVSSAVAAEAIAHALEHGQPKPHLHWVRNGDFSRGAAERR